MKYKLNQIVEYKHTDWWEIDTERVESFDTVRRGKITEEKEDYCSIEVDPPKVQLYGKVPYFKINDEWVEGRDVIKVIKH